MLKLLRLGNKLALEKRLAQRRKCLSVSILFLLCGPKASVKATGPIFYKISPKCFKPERTCSKQDISMFTRAVVNNYTYNWLVKRMLSVGVRMWSSFAGETSQHCSFYVLVIELLQQSFIIFDNEYQIYNLLPGPYSLLLSDVLPEHLKMGLGVFSF